MDRVIPSPAPSMREHSPAVLNSLVPQHHIASQPRCANTPFEVKELVFRSTPRYSTPEPQNISRHASPSMAYTQPHQGLPFQYPALHPGEAVGAYETAHAASTPQLYNLNTPEASPPTAPQQLSGSPGLSSMSTPQRATQGMKVLAAKAGRVSKSAAQKKKAGSRSPSTAKQKAATAKASKKLWVTEPLSVFTKDWDVPIVDIETYVHRSAARRHKEVQEAKVPGKVKRAMNAFMLYRKAYQERIKRYTQQDNHQVVSTVCGQSWAIEPDNVRQQYNDWAVIERDNHRKAHPEYKFTPSKPRKKGKDEFGDDSDGEDAEWDGAARRDPTHVSASRQPTIDPHGAPYGYGYPVAVRPDAQPYGFPPRHPQHVANPATHATNPYDTEEYATGSMHYRHASTDNHHQLDNMLYTNTAQQGTGIGLGAAHHQSRHQGFDLGGQYPPQAPNIGAAAHHPNHHHSHGHPTGSVGQQIDPSLMSRDGMPQYDMSNPVLATGGLSDSQWQHSLHTNTDTSDMYAGPYLAEVEESLIPENHLQYLQGDNESWKVDAVNEPDDWQGMGGA
ncbi:hypothetical protein SEUCBS140593_009140 [Sporothrix eucalyptigena]|uniref:HMG box domain-containing protein n=1 Tax=Sporothrix eucalyptigena TaxID=1812306 RepID=A0ABP0CSM1_9PEZI